MSKPCFASVQDRAAMAALWAQAFEDDEREIEAFFDRFFSRHTALVIRDGKRLVSMLFLLPATAVLPQGTCRRVGYIYGGATCEEERGKGYYRRLIEFAKEAARTQGMNALFLHPADETLDRSYIRMGFRVPLTADVRALPADVPRDDNATPLPMREYAQLRRRLLRERGAAFIDWDDDVPAHCGEWCEAYAFGQTACALIAKDGAMVYEFLSSDASDVRLPANSLSAPAYWRGVGENTVVGRLCPLDDDGVWNAPLYMGYGME